jgi:hypothetical protein
MTATPVHPGEHPSPRRDRIRLDLLLFALACGPFAWIVQLVGDYALASHACRPGDAPRLTPPAAGWRGEHLVLVGVNLACLALCLAGGAIAMAAWRRSHREKAPEGRDLIAVTEDRTQFLAVCGVIAAAIFALAMAFDTTLPFFVPSCWRFAP